MPKSETDLLASGDFSDVGIMAYEDRRRRSVFEQSYHCYPVSMIDKPHLEKGDKIIMPSSALDRLATLRIDYPMLFELNNPTAGRVSHCGVMEFVADEGFVYLPYWMMENMSLQEGDIVQVKSTSLTKGTFVKLQPHTKDFLDISNPKAILETTLRNNSCLTTGDTIMVPYNNKKYYINIVETKPSIAVCIIETDCEVEFATPLDYKEPEKPAPSSALSNKKPQEVEEDEPPLKISKFNPFSGSSRRLDGKSSMQSAPLGSSPSIEKQQVVAEKGTTVSESQTMRRHSGKLVFGSNTNNQLLNETPKVATKKGSQKASQKVEEPKFQAFTGKSIPPFAPFSKINRIQDFL